MKITPELLLKAVGCTVADAERFASPLQAACEAYNILSPARLAAFLAQIGHESGAFRYTSEIWGPTPAQERYEGRRDLGNTQPGDGSTYRGHGLIQVTGRANHARVRDRLQLRFGSAYAPDFEACPELLMDPKWAAMSAADYWDDRGLNALADAGNFEAITRRINGGLNGQDDRLKRWAKATAALAHVESPGAAGADVPAAPPTETVVIEPAQPAPKETRMPFPAIIAALLPSLISAVPELTKMFKPGDEKAERNAAAAATVFKIAQTALDATNEQETIQRIESDPVAAAAVREAIKTQWFDIVEAGGGGIEGARKADVVYSTGQAKFWMSPSFWAMAAMLPMVYLILGAMVGLYGKLELSAEVTASIITGIVTLIIGSSTGYYFGSTTSKNAPVQTTNPP